MEESISQPWMPTVTQVMCMATTTFLPCAFASSIQSLTCSRSHLLTGTYGALSVVDRDNSYAANQGTVFATVGNGGHKSRTVTTAGWVAVANGTNSPGGISYGHAVVSVAPTGLSYQYVRDAGAALSDQFSMSR